MWGRLVVLGAVGAALWVNALLGDDLAGNTVCLALVAGLAFLAGWRSRLPELIITGVVVAGLLTVANQVASPGEFSLANDGVFYAAIVMAPALLAWLLGSRTRQLAELRRRATELGERRAGAVAAARAGEAERVERNVDVALAARLGEIIADVREAESLAASDTAAMVDWLAKVELTAREALSELRAVLDVLRPEPVGESDDGPMPSAPVVDRRLDRFDVLLVLAAAPLAVETALTNHQGPAWLTVAASVGLGLLLVMVRRRPLAGAALLFALASAQTAWLSSLPPTVSWMLPGLLVPFLAGVALPLRTATLGLGLALLGYGAVVLATAQADRALDGVVPSAVMTVLAWWAGRSVAVRQARTVALRMVVDELARTRDQQVSLAAAEQRAEMVRDLHDVGAHTLTVVCLQAGAARKLWDSDRDRAVTALSALRELASGPLAHLGQSLGELGAEGSERPLDPAALDALAGLGRVLGLDVAVEVHGEPRDLDRTVARAAFRVVQESLTNAARHAVHTTVRVGLHYTPETLEIRINDTGPGPVTALAPVGISGSGVGLRGMRERVEACHGELASGPSGPGFTVQARLPLGVVP